MEISISTMSGELGVAQPELRTNEDSKFYKALVLSL